MFKKLKYKIANFFFSEYMENVAHSMQAAVTLKNELNDTVNRRVVETLAKMDPFEPLMKEYNGIFSREYERPEDSLNSQGKVGMYIWAWQQKNDPYFAYMVDWIMNKSGNSLLKKENPTELQTFYKRAEIANMILYRKEVGRLASNYEEMLSKKGSQEFDDTVGIE